MLRCAASDEREVEEVEAGLDVSRDSTSAAALALHSG